MLCIFFYNCPKPADVSCTANPLYFRLVDPADDITIQTGNLDFDVDFDICDKYFGQNSWLSVRGPRGPNSLQHDVGDWTLPNQLHASHTYSYFFSQPGIYEAWVGLGDANHQKPNYASHTEIITITVTGEVQRDFRIHELSMVGDELWPSYNTYNGIMKRDGAYEEANTIITVISSKPDIPKQDDLSSEDALFTWVKGQFGGKWPDMNTAILCGIEDASYLVPGNFGATYSQESGFKIPARSFIFNKRIRNSDITGTLNRTIAIASMGIHELGHARGINDPFHGGHGGSNANKCIMDYPLVINNIIYPHFCGDHINDLKEIDWKIIERIKK